jgi:hypothetical protein
MSQTSDPEPDESVSSFFRSGPFPSGLLTTIFHAFSYPPCYLPELTAP